MDEKMRLKALRAFAAARGRSLMGFQSLMRKITDDVNGTVRGALFCTDEPHTGHHMSVIEVTAAAVALSGGANSAAAICNIGHEAALRTDDFGPWREFGRSSASHDASGRDVRVVTFPPHPSADVVECDHCDNHFLSDYNVLVLACAGGQSREGVTEESLRNIERYVLENSVSSAKVILSNIDGFDKLLEEWNPKRFTKSGKITFAVDVCSGRSFFDYYVATPVPVFTKHDEVESPHATPIPDAAATDVDELASFIVCRTRKVEGDHDCDETCGSECDLSESDTLSVADDPRYFAPVYPVRGKWDGDCTPANAIFLPKSMREQMEAISNAHIKVFSFHFNAFISNDHVFRPPDNTDMDLSMFVPDNDSEFERAFAARERYDGCTYQFEVSNDPDDPVLRAFKSRYAN